MAALGPTYLAVAVTETKLLQSVVAQTLKVR